LNSTIPSESVSVMSNELELTMATIPNESASVISNNLEQTLNSTIPNESVSVISNKLCSEIVTSEQFKEVVKNIEMMRPRFIAHKIEYENFAEILRQAEESARKTAKYGHGLYASISAMIKTIFLDVTFFTSSHEDMLLDYIFIDIYGWHPTNSKFWIFDKQNKSQRAHRFAFQPKIKRFANSVVHMIRKIKREALKSKLLVEFRKENRDVLNSSSISSKSVTSSSSNILSMNVKELEQNQEESVQEIETGDILMIHQAIGGFLQPQDDDGDINTDNWESGQVYIFLCVSVCQSVCWSV
jgi:hypothetical protein